MPTTKKRCLKILFSILLLSALFSCDSKKTESYGSHKNPYEITFVSVSEIGGNLGSYRIIKATGDSVFAEKGMTANQTHKKWSSAINARTWKKLISSVNITDLDHKKLSQPTVCRWDR
ncbi:hypothetical protein OWR28_02990 [Chryseobacterium sp. 1B4]